MRSISVRSLALRALASAAFRSTIQMGQGKSSWTSCFSIMAAIISGDCRIVRSVVQLSKFKDAGGTDADHRPSGHAEFRRRSGRCRSRPAAVWRRRRRHQGGLHQICSADFPRPDLQRREPSRFRPPFRSARDQRVRDPPGSQDAPASAHGRCRQPRCRRQDSQGRRSHPALPARQSAMAHRLLVQAVAGVLLDPAWPLDPAGRRSHRVRRPARGLRRPARDDQAQDRRPRGRAFIADLARQARLQRFRRD